MVLGPTQSFTRSGARAGWLELLSSELPNKKFLGLPRGVYLGFAPVASGLTLTLKPDTAIAYTNLINAFAVGVTITGGSSGATATVVVSNNGFLLLDNVVGGPFQIGETITAGPASAQVSQYTTEASSAVTLATSIPLSPTRVEDAITIFTTDPVVLNFTGFPDDVYYVMATASFVLGVESAAHVIARTTPPPDGISEIALCTVTKAGLALSVASDSPANRTEPYAKQGSRFGYLPGGSVSALQAAMATTQEVVAARRETDGVVAPAFDPNDPQETGLPLRLADDLSRAGQARRLGKIAVELQGNDYAVSAPITEPMNVSGSFSARTRDHISFRDFSNGELPQDVPVPIALNPNGSDAITVTLTGVTGAFGVGSILVGASSDAKAVIRSIAGTALEVIELVGVLAVGETVTAAGPPLGSGTIASIDLREGAITAAADGSSGNAEHNLVYVVDTLTGKQPLNSAANPIYGRLLFGPNGTSGTGGGDPGELLVGATAGQQLNFVNSSTAVTGNNIDFTEFLLPGDIIEGADGRFYEVDPDPTSVQPGFFELTAGKPYLGPNASAGLGVGPGPRRRRRYLLKFVSLVAGTEIEQTITAGTNIPATAGLRIFFPAWLTCEQSQFSSIFAMSAPGDGWPLATTTLAGIGYNAPGSGTGGPVPGSPVIGAVRTIQASAAPVGPGNFHTINFAATPGVAITPGTAGVINITAPGPVGPTGPAGPPAPTGPTGPTGPGFATIAPLQTFQDTINAVDDRNHIFDFSPLQIKFYTVDCELKGNALVLDTAYITGVTATYNGSTITVAYHIDNAGSNDGVDLILIAAAAG